MEPVCTVIIPNLNGAAFLRACLDSLYAQRGAIAQILIVDNGSTDGSRQIVEGHPLRPRWLGFSGNIGFAAAVNAGIRESRSEVVALLNNDTLADPRWLWAGLSALAAHPAADIVASLMIRVHERDLVDSAGDMMGLDCRPRSRGRGARASGYDMPVEVFAASAGAAFFRRRVFEELGLFEESFFSYLEDVDFCFRARLMNKSAIFWPAAVVYHYGAGTALHDREGVSRYDSEQRVEWIARNRIWLYLRNMPGPLLPASLPRWLAGLMSGAGYHLFVSGQGRAFWRGLKQGMRGMRVALAARRDIQSGSRAAASDIRDMMTGGARDLS